MRRLSLGLLLLCGMGAAIAWAEDRLAPPASQLTLQHALDELDVVDQQIAQAKQQRASATTRRERRAITRRLEGLETRQAQLVHDIERMAGPLPPRVQSEPPEPLEEQLETRQRHHDALLERDVTRRLPSN